MDQARCAASAMLIGSALILSQEMVRWADVVIGDYNYYFDGGGLLYSLQVENEWRIGLLVDEAHKPD